MSYFCAEMQQPATTPTAGRVRAAEAGYAAAVMDAIA